LFFGLFGAHRLYVERKSGMLQLGLGIVGMILVFSNDGAALVIGIIMLTGDISWVVLDAVRLITNSFTDGAGEVVALTPKIIQEQRRQKAYQEHPKTPQALHELEILKYLELQGGLITETRTAIYIEDTLKVVRRDLDKMVAAGYIEPRTTIDGKMVYVNEELLTSENEKLLEPLV